MPQYTIRHATIQDIDSLIELLRILFSHEPDFAFNAEKQRCGLKLMLSEPSQRCVFVAEEEGRVIGMCTAQLLVTTAEGGMAALIEDMVVREEYRRQGVGAGLLGEIETWARVRGVKRLELLADRENTLALMFYDKLNWQRTRMICLHKK